MREVIYMKEVEIIAKLLCNMWETPTSYKYQVEGRSYIKQGLAANVCALITANSLFTFIVQYIYTYIHEFVP